MCHPSEEMYVISTFHPQLLEIPQENRTNIKPNVLKKEICENRITQATNKTRYETFTVDNFHIELGIEKR